MRPDAAALGKTGLRTWVDLVNVKVLTLLVADNAVAASGAKLDQTDGLEVWRTNLQPVLVTSQYLHRHFVFGTESLRACDVQLLRLFADAEALFLQLGVGLRYVDQVVDCLNSLVAQVDQLGSRFFEVEVLRERGLVKLLHQ